MSAARTQVGKRNVESAYELTVVSPTFNERANVRALIAKLDAALAGIASLSILKVSSGAWRLWITKGISRSLAIAICEINSGL